MHQGQNSHHVENENGAIPYRDSALAFNLAFKQLLHYCNNCWAIRFSI